MTRRGPRLGAIVAVGYVLVYLATLGLRPMVATDEYRYAEIPREMRASGDWIVPRLDGMPYFEKPAGGYWATAISQSLLGETAFATRLPAALAAGLSALMTWWVLRRYGRGRRTAALGAGLLLASVLGWSVGTTAILDAPFAALLAACLVAFFAATEAPRGARRNAWLAAAGAAAGGAFLVKGFLAFAIPGVVAAPYLLWGRRWRDLATMPWIPLVAAVVVASPWSLLVARADGDFWRYFFWEEHVHRFSADEAAQHASPFWFYLPVLLVGGMPATLFAAEIVAGLRRAWRRDALLRFAICWLAGPLLLLSLSSGKLATYLAPCLPAIAILGASGMLRRLTTGGAAGLRRAGLVCAAVGGVLAAAGIVAPLLVDVALAWRPPVAPGLAAAAACGLAFGAAAWLGARSRRRSQLLAAVVTAPLAGWALMPLAFPTALDAKTPAGFLDAHADLLPADAILVADSNTVHVLCWRMRRSDVALVESLGELDYGLLRPEGAGRRWRLADLERAIADPDRDRPLVLFTLDRRFRDVGEPPPADRTAEGRGLTLRTYRARSDATGGAEAPEDL